MVVRGMISIATDLGINSSTDEWPVLSTRYVDSDISLCVRTDNDTNCRLRPEKRSTLRIIEWPQAYIKFLVLQACLGWESHESLENGLMSWRIAAGDTIWSTRHSYLATPDGRLIELFQLEDWKKLSGRRGDAIISKHKLTRVSNWGAIDPEISRRSDGRPDVTSYMFESKKVGTWWHGTSSTISR